MFLLSDLFCLRHWIRCSGSSSETTWLGLETDCHSMFGLKHAAIPHWKNGSGYIPIMPRDSLQVLIYQRAMSDPSHYCYNLYKEHNVCISETAVAQTKQQHSTGEAIQDVTVYIQVLLNAPKCNLLIFTPARVPVSLEVQGTKFFVLTAYSSNTSNVLL